MWKTVKLREQRVNYDNILLEVQIQLCSMLPLSFWVTWNNTTYLFCFLEPIYTVFLSLGITNFLTNTVVIKKIPFWILEYLFLQHPLYFSILTLVLFLPLKISSYFFVLYFITAASTQWFLIYVLLLSSAKINPFLRCSYSNELELLW